MSETYAEERILEKIDALPMPHQRHGLREVNEGLKTYGVPAAERLHLLTALIHLGRLSSESLSARVERSVAAK